MTPSPTHTRSVNKRLLSAQGYYQGEHLLWLPKAEGHELYRLMSKNYSKQGTRSWPQQNKSLKGQIWNSQGHHHSLPQFPCEYIHFFRVVNHPPPLEHSRKLLFSSWVELSFARQVEVAYHVLLATMWYIASCWVISWSWIGHIQLLTWNFLWASSDSQATHSKLAWRVII